MVQKNARCFAMSKIVISSSAVLVFGPLLFSYIACLVFTRRPTLRRRAHMRGLGVIYVVAVGWAIDEQQRRGEKKRAKSARISGDVRLGGLSVC